MSLRHRFEAFGELLGRYRAVLVYCWRVRARLAGPALRAEEAEFLPAALALQGQPVSPLGRTVAYILCGMVVSVFVWATIGQLDIVVNAPGRIIPTARTKTIASVEVASVRSIHVTEGQTVKAGDVLVELDSSAWDAERDKALGKYREALLQIARAEALLDAIEARRPPTLPSVTGVAAKHWSDAQRHLMGEYEDFVAKLNHLDTQVQRYGEALPLAEKQAGDYRELALSRDVAPHAYLQKELARVELEGELKEASSERAALFAETRKAAYEMLDDGRKTADETRQDAIQAASHSRLLKLTAPVDGTVQQLAVHTVGGVVPAAQPLMQIVPAGDSVEVEATLENKDIGFVEDGQPVAVKVEAFNYTKYGTVPGTVTHVSRDAVQDEKRGLLYTVRIVLQDANLVVDGHKLPLSPGLAVNAEIKTGRRRVIEYALSPLIRHSQESLRER